MTCTVSTDDFDAAVQKGAWQGKCCEAKWRTQAWHAVLSSNESGTTTCSSGDFHSISESRCSSCISSCCWVGISAKQKGVPGAARARLRVNDP